MCGIFATTRPDLWKHLIPRVTEALRHRGPDSEGVWESPSGRALLLQTRLSIVGLGSEGYQPSVHPATALVVNGEIYNYRDLADAEQLTGPLSDTQVLHRRLDAEGPPVCDRLRGMYAFAYWNEADGSLTIGRDPWGIKPLYILRHPSGGVTVCSELPPLNIHPDGRDFDETGVAQYIAFGHTGPEHTVFANITKAAIGTSTTLRPGKTPVERRIDQRGHFESLSLEAALEDSIAAHFVADVEVGVFLSGGIDSTLVARLASDRFDRLKTFTVSFPDHSAINESELAEHNARLIGSDHRTVPATNRDMLRALDRFLAIQGEPFGDPAAIPVVILAEEAARHVKVVQTGEGADEIFGGYRRYDVMGKLGSPWMRHVGKVGSPLANQWFVRRDGSARSRAVEAVMRGGGPRGLAALIDSDLPVVAGSTAGRVVDDELYRDWAKTAGDAVGREAARRFDLVRWLPNTYLEKTDRATMAASLEARTPYLDPVVAAAAAAPGRGFGKADVRQLLERRVPGVTLPDIKKGLAIPIPALLDAGLGADLQWALKDDESLINQMLGERVAGQLARRASRSPASAYRTAVFGRWQQRGGFS
jgi:asparagine synthase (glutamine-hydrolysing)